MSSDGQTLLNKARAAKTNGFRHQRLEISAGWTVKWNNFINVNPLELAEDALEWACFSEELAYFVKEHKGWEIDLGWYGGLNKDGCYAVVLFENGTVKESFLTNSLDDITDVLNYFFKLD